DHDAVAGLELSDVAAGSRHVLNVGRAWTRSGLVYAVAAASNRHCGSESASAVCFKGRCLRVTIIIPFHRDLSHLDWSLRAARDTMPEAEIIVAADGARDDCRPLARAAGAAVIDIPGPSGPAVARNRAAAAAGGELLVF